MLIRHEMSHLVESGMYFFFHPLLCLHSSRYEAGEELGTWILGWNLHITRTRRSRFHHHHPSSRIRDDVFDAVAALCGVVNVVSVAALLAARHQFGKVEEIRQTGKTS